MNLNPWKYLGKRIMFSFSHIFPYTFRKYISFNISKFSQIMLELSSFEWELSIKHKPLQTYKIIAMIARLLHFNNVLSSLKYIAYHYFNNEVFMIKIMRPKH